MEKGESATYYTPHIDDSGMKIKMSGRNLLPFPYEETTKTQNGIEWNIELDGKITALGTATDFSSFGCYNGILPVSSGNISFGLCGEFSNAGFVIKLSDDSNNELVTINSTEYATVNISNYPTARGLVRYFEVAYKTTI